MELVVHPLDRVLQVLPGANLLETLRANEVPISYSCMAGRCGTCRCKVVSGNVIETGREAKLTNPAEGDYVLACTSVLTESCAIEIPEPDEIVTTLPASSRRPSPRSPMRPTTSRSFA